MTREHDKFQIELADTRNGLLSCVRCADKISIFDDPEHVVAWPPRRSAEGPWHFHINCYSDVVSGMVEFHRVFISEQGKLKVSN